MKLIISRAEKLLLLRLCLTLSSAYLLVTMAIQFSLHDFTENSKNHQFLYMFHLVYTTLLTGYLWLQTRENLQNGTVDRLMTVWWLLMDLL